METDVSVNFTFPEQCVRSAKLKRRNPTLELVAECQELWAVAGGEALGWREGAV